MLENRSCDHFVFTSCVQRYTKKQSVNLNLHIFLNISSPELNSKP